MSSSPRVIALVGFMGSGKSTIGAALAARLGLPFVDLDAALETSSGTSIRRWFETAGEPAFRLVERAELATVLDQLATGGEGGVLALGGGAWSDPANRALVAGHARTIWLDVPLDAVRARLPEGAGRPLYRDPAAIARLFAARQADYARADLRIDATEAVPAVVERIVAGLAARPGAQGGGA